MPLTRYTTDSIEWIQSGGRDQWGEPLAPTVVSVLARVDRSQRLVRDFSGQEVMAAGFVLMTAGRPTPGADKLKWDGEEHLVIAVTEKRSYSRRAYWVYFS